MPLDKCPPATLLDRHFSRCQVLSRSLQPLQLTGLGTIVRACLNRQKSTFYPNLRTYDTTYGRRIIPRNTDPD